MLVIREVGESEYGMGVRIERAKNCGKKRIRADFWPSEFQQCPRQDPLN